MSTSPAASALEPRLRERYPELVAARGELTVVVEREDLMDELAWLKDSMGLGFLASLTATDWPDRSPRFWLAYELRSLDPPARLRVKVGLPVGDPHVPSVTGPYPTADWHERETFDLYGIEFDGHPSLTRILLPDGWEGYPLRKTEPLGGVNTRFHGAFHPPIDQRIS
jgi:NADH-quinone oxidoreductase subunit C